MSLPASPLANVPRVLAAQSPATEQRARDLRAEQLRLLYMRGDRMFVILIGIEYLACLLGAFITATNGPGSALVICALATLFAGAPLAMARWRSGDEITRHVVAAGQMLLCALIIHLSGGRAESHFLVFGSLAFLGFYRDWRVLATASAVVCLDYMIRGIGWPGSIFGLAQVDHWRWIEHIGWVLFEDAFLMISVRHGLDLLGGITQRRAELEQARDLAEHASRAKDEFMAVLSHELRTPLTPSIMTLEALAEDERLDTRARADVAMVLRNIQLEARLIDDLLDLTRITSGKFELSSGNVDLHAILRHILEACRGEFRGKQLSVTDRLEAQRIWCFGDAARLQQVFWNLIRNAVKFTPAGGRIEVKTQDAGDKIRVDITDSGMGITPEVLPKIFERFEQGGSDVTKQFGGLGLGLSIARTIIEKHRGIIRADSRGRGWGSTFTIALPARIEGPSTGTPITHTQKLRLSGLLPRRVLLVDDHLDTRETLAKLLDRAGYNVTCAGSVSEALEKAGASKYDILVSDLGLPDGHGNDLMRSVHERYRLPGVAFSGYGMEDDVRQSLEAGFSAHLTKPVDFKRLKEAIGRALHNDERSPKDAAA